MKRNLEQKVNGKNEIIIIGSPDESLKKYAREQGLSIETYSSEEDYHRRQVQNTSFGDFTRKSIVGAGYRVGASFAMDAIYLTAAGAVGYCLAKKAGMEESVMQSACDFIKNLDPAKLARVAAAVVLINFADYRWDITNHLDNVTKWMGRKVKSLVFRR